MAELEIHHEHPHASDPMGRKVGVAAGVIGIVLAVVTIASHREHTAAVIHRTEANDQWAFYQAKKNRETTLGVGITVLEVLAPQDPKAKAAVDRMRGDRERYLTDVESIKQAAEAQDQLSEGAERRAFRFDVAEGLLELGLVLCSLYFLSRKILFPVCGVTAAVLGTLVGASGLF